MPYRYRKYLMESSSKRFRLHRGETAATTEALAAAVPMAAQTTVQSGNVKPSIIVAKDA